MENDNKSKSPQTSGGTPRAQITAGDEQPGPIVQTRVVREGGGGSPWPMLTRTNYGDWALLMQVKLEGRHLWEAIETGMAVRSDNRLAMEAILCGVPPEMVATLAAKSTAKEAWEALKTMRLGVARVREAKAATLSK